MITVFWLIIWALIFAYVAGILVTFGLGVWFLYQWDSYGRNPSDDDGREGARWVRHSLVWPVLLSQWFFSVLRGVDRQERENRGR